MEINKVLDYYHYKNLGFKNFESWSEDDLSQFLVWDFLNATVGTTVLKDFKSFIENNNFIVEKRGKSQIVFDFLDRVVFSLSLVLHNRRKGKKNARKKILFQNPNYRYLISAARKKYFVGLMRQGNQERLFARKDFAGYININNLEQYFFSYLKTRDIKYLREMVKTAEDKLKIIRPDYIVLGSDTGPAERAIALASKKLGIVTMEIQHGTYGKPTNDKKTTSELLTDGKAVDYVLVWGKYFRDLYVGQKARNADDIYILGYPHLFSKKSDLGNKKETYTVCFLAQGYEKYNRDLLPEKLESIKQISKICKNLGLKFIYRPHPWGEEREMMEKNLPGIEFTAVKERLKETFEGADIFISFSSTALVEAAMKQKIALQLLNFPIKLDNLEELGACSKSFENLAQVEDFLTKIASSPNLDRFKNKFNNEYIETEYEPGQRFLEIMEQIEKNQKSEI